MWTLTKGRYQARLAETDDDLEADQGWTLGWAGDDATDDQDDVLDAIRQLDPEQPALWRMLGQLLHQEGRWEELVEILLRLAELSADELGVDYRLAAEALDDRSVVVVNSTLQGFQGMKVTARVLDLEGQERHTQRETVDVGPDSSAIAAVPSLDSAGVQGTELDAP